MTFAPVGYNEGDIGPGGGFVFYVNKSRAEGSQWAFGDSDNAICNANGDNFLSMTLGAFSLGDYWVSSEEDDPYAVDEFIGSLSAFTQSFDFGYQGSYTKSGAGGDYVRPVRKF